MHHPWHPSPLTSPNTDYRRPAVGAEGGELAALVRSPAIAPYVSDTEAPAAPMATIAAMEIKAATKPYSITVAPASGEFGQHREHCSVYLLGLIDKNKSLF